MSCPNSLLHLSERKTSRAGYEYADGLRLLRQGESQPADWRKSFGWETSKQFGPSSVGSPLPTPLADSHQTRRGAITFGDITEDQVASEMCCIATLAMRIISAQGLLMDLCCEEKSFH